MKCPFLSNYNTNMQQKKKFSGCEQEERVDMEEEKNGGLLAREEDRRERRWNLGKRSENDTCEQVGAEELREKIIMSYM